MNEQKPIEIIFNSKYKRITNMSWVGVGLWVPAQPPPPPLHESTDNKLELILG